MTIAQIRGALRIDDESPIRLTTSQAASMASQKRREIFDRIIERNQWIAGRLLELPLTELATHIQREIGGGEVEMKMLAVHLDQYIANKRQEGLA